MKHRVTTTIWSLFFSAAMASIIGCDDSVSSGPSEDVIGTQSAALQILTDLEGKKYIFDIPSANWSEPPEFGDEIVKVQPLLAFEIVAIDEAHLTFDAFMGAAKDGVQDMCNTTATVQGVITDEEEPSFILGPMNAQDIVFVGPESKALSASHDILITGKFVGDSAELVSGSLEALLDAREIYPLFYETDAASGEALCEMMAEWELPCEECTFDPGVDLCIYFEAEDFTISEMPDLVLTEITEIAESCLE